MPLFINPRKRGFYLLFCLLGTGGSLVLLSLLSGFGTHRANGFIRLVPPHVAIPGPNRDLTYNSWYFAGGTPFHVYLGNRAVPSYIMILNNRLSDSASQRISLRSAGGRFTHSLRITIDSPGIYLSEGITPTLAKGLLGDSVLHRDSAKFYFDLAIPLSPVSRIFRAVDDRQHLNILAKQLNGNVTRGDNILEKQVDGIFCTDGDLHAQPDSNRLLYIYHYRNQFVCMDTNMHVLYKAHTIDTNSRVKLSVGNVPSEKAITMSSPPVFVNEQSCISGNYLFIHSPLHADNEELNVYARTSPIDVYSLIDGHYLLSFYIPDFHNKKIRDFRVFGNTLVALYDHYIYSYTLHIPKKLKQ